VALGGERSYADPVSGISRSYGGAAAVRGPGKPARYTPVRFVPKNKLGKDAKLLLAETTRTRRPGSRKKKKRTMVMMIAVPMVKMIVVMAMAMRRAAVVVLLPVVRRWTWWWRMITATARRETKEATALTRKWSGGDNGVALREAERGRQPLGIGGKTTLQEVPDFLELCLNLFPRGIRP